MPSNPQRTSLKASAKYSLPAAMATRAGAPQSEQKPVTGAERFSLADAMRRRAQLPAGR